MTKPRYRYKGPDTFHGVPARDLTEDEFNRLPVLRQLDVKANASYVEVKPEPKASEKKSADSGKKGGE